MKRKGNPLQHTVNRSKQPPICSLPDDASHGASVRGVSSDDPAVQRPEEFTIRALKKLPQYALVLEPNTRTPEYLVITIQLPETVSDLKRCTFFT